MGNKLRKFKDASRRSNEGGTEGKYGVLGDTADASDPKKKSSQSKSDHSPEENSVPLPDATGQPEATSPVTTGQPEDSAHTADTPETDTDSEHQVALHISISAIVFSIFSVSASTLNG